MGKKDEKEEKKKKLSDKEAEKIIAEYMQNWNRPYSVQVLYDNLHGTVGKTQAQKLLQQLADKGNLTCKEFGKQKIYWRNQEGLESVDKATLDDFDAKIKALEKERNQINEQCKTFSARIKELSNEPTTVEAENEIAKLSKENMTLQTRLTGIKQNQVVVTPEEKKQAQQQYESYRIQWKKKKKNVP